jgi:hypothetical protein
MSNQFRLSTGRHCVLLRPSLPFLLHYHVLASPRDQGPPSAAEVDEAFLLANRKGRELGRLYFGDEECFSLIYNAARTRRKPWFHIHILPARNTAAKRIAFVAFSLKNLIRPFLPGRLWRMGRASEPWPL